MIEAVIMRIEHERRHEQASEMVREVEQAGGKWGMVDVGQ